jgi:gas vesicle protein
MRKRVLRTEEQVEYIVIGILIGVMLGFLLGMVFADLYG